MVTIDYDHLGKAKFKVLFDCKKFSKNLYSSLTCPIQNNKNNLCIFQILYDHFYEQIFSITIKNL